MERVLDALADLPVEHSLRVLLLLEPFPLYSILKLMGYRWRTERKDERYEVLIWSHGVRPLGREI